MVAAMPFIRDDSNDKQFVDHWNNAKPHARGKLLKAAGFSITSYQYRVWAYVPHYIRVDIVAIIKRQQREKQAKQKPASNTTQIVAISDKTNNKKFWWQDSEKEPENV